MPEGFFPESSVLSKEAPSRIAKCGACKLYTKCKSPKMEPTGEGEKRILLLGEAPGEQEDNQGAQFVGKTGQRLERTLRRLGVDMREDCILSNALICRPPNNETPTAEQLSYCRPNLVRTLEDYEIDVVIPLGGAAVRSLIGHLWKEDPGGITQWSGWRVPNQKPNVWICPTFHPSYVERELNPRYGPPNKVPDHLFTRHLEAAVELSGKPWESLPDYESQVRIVYDHRQAARFLRRIIDLGGTIAFDYECNCLKPENPKAKILSCAVSWEGKRTFAYPWVGEAIQATWDLLDAKHVRKIGTNIKFEERWTRKFHGTGVKGWKFCTLVGAHWEDNRQKITSLKFQAFVRLGAVWDEKIKPFMDNGPDGLNRLEQEVSLEDLLLYNGMDALLEYHVGTDLIEVYEGTDP